MTNLRQYVVYECVIGSRAYGLEQVGSDTDVRGVYVPPARLHWSLDGVPDQFPKRATLAEGEPDEVFYEIERFIRLALKANPSILEMLFTDTFSVQGKLKHIGMQLRERRHDFLSKRVYHTYRGYAQSQFLRFERSGAVNPKMAMHVIRLLVGCRSILRLGELEVRPTDYWRRRLSSIREGVITYDGWLDLKQGLEADIDEAVGLCRLPETPDETFANDILLAAREAAQWLRINASPAL